MLDGLRGFALLGVLVVNVLQAYSVALSPLDAHVAAVIRALGEGTFYPMFSFLFGLGVALQLAKGEAALLKVRRRLAVLIVIGLLHHGLIWSGDILLEYALLGFVLLRFRNQSDNQLRRSALLLYGVTALFILSGADSFSADVEPDMVRETYPAILAERLQGLPLKTLDGIFSFGPALLAFFLLGYASGRRGPQRVLAARPYLRRVHLISLALAAPLTLWTLGVGPRQGSSLLFAAEYILSSPLLTAAYLAGLPLIAGDCFTGLFKDVGRMALSNYLAQSLICTFIFYPYGLGQLGKLGAARTLLISLGIFAAQIVISRLWLNAFRFGPAEWAWRSLTYGKAQPLLRTKS